MNKHHKPREIIAAALTKLSQEGPPFDNVAGSWEPQENEAGLTVSMQDMVRFMEAVLEELCD